MSKKTNQRVVFAIVVVSLLLVSFIAGRMKNQPINVQAQELPDSEERAGFSPCEVEQVAMYPNRAHVKCKDPVPATTIRFFAVADTPANKTLINRVLAIGLTQMSMNRYLYIEYDANSANNPPGCLSTDCRKLTGIMGYK